MSDNREIMRRHFENSVSNAELIRRSVENSTSNAELIRRSVESEPMDQSQRESDKEQSDLMEPYRDGARYAEQLQEQADHAKLIGPAAEDGDRGALAAPPFS